MSDRRTDPSLLDLNRGTLVAAAALCAVGSILGLMGLALAAAAIVVLLVVLLAMNSFAIWLRNKYERRW